MKEPTGERNIFRLRNIGRDDRASGRKRVNRPARTIEVVTNYELSRPHAKMPFVERVSVLFFDIKGQRAFRPVTAGR